MKRELYKMRKKLRKKLRRKGFSSSDIEKAVQEKTAKVLEDCLRFFAFSEDVDIAQIEDGLDYLSECGDKQ